MIGAAGYLPASVRARSSGARACRSVSARRIGEGPFIRSPSTSARTAAATSAGGPLTCRAATGARPDGAPVPSAPASDVGCRAAAPGTSARGEGVGAPLERVAAAHLDHQVGPEHRHPAPQEAGFAELRRVEVTLLRREAGRGRRCRRHGRTVGGVAAVRQDARHGGHLPAAPIARRCRPAGHRRERVEHRPGALRSAVETTDQHQSALVGRRRDGRLERADAAPRRGQADRLDDSAGRRERAKRPARWRRRPGRRPGTAGREPAPQVRPG